MKYLSLFSGIGGFELGIQQVYESTNRTIRKKEIQSDKDKSDNISDILQRDTAQSSRASCIGFSEIDKYAIQIYERHFPTHRNWGDATKIVAEGLPDFDLLVAGFPCQSFSIAGKRGGFKDTRGTLFFEIARIAKVKRPPYLLLENVKGLLNHDKGNTFATIVSTLDELGYDCQWCVLNSKNYGVPQNRERVFIVGHLRGEPRPKVFPIRGSDKENKGVVYHQKADKEIARIYDPKGIAPTLHLKTGGWQEPKISNASKREFGFKDISPTLMGRDYKEPKIVRHPLKFLERNQKNIEGDYAFTVDSVNTGGIKEFGRIRRLTPTECERLQGFPDGWTGGVSDTQRYKCLGNAVTVNVVREIMKQIIKEI